MYDDSQMELARLRLHIFQTLLGAGRQPEEAIGLTEKVYEAFYLGKAPKPALKRKATKKR